MDLPRFLPLTAALTPRVRLLVGAVAAIGAAAVVLVAIAAGPREVLVGVGVFSGAGLCALRAWLGPAPRRPWAAFTVAILLYAIGAAVHEAVFADQVESYSGVADLLWSGFYVGAYVAIGLLIRSRLRKVHPIGWLDGAIGACAGGALGAALLYEPVADFTGGSTAAVAINLAYPVADVLLIGFLAMLLAIEGWRLSRSRMLILAALLVLLVSDTGYLLLAASGTYHAGLLIDAGWPTVMLLLGIAAWEDQGIRGRARVRPWVAMAAPSIFTLAAVALVIYGNLRPLGVVALVLATLTLLLGVVRTALTFRAIQELALRRRQAVTDELTGLPNRRALYERLDRAIAARAGGRLTLLLLDLDGFKEVNDSLGHNAGDLLLREIGPRLRDALRDQDILARLGGDEFGVLLEDAGVDDAMAVASRVRSALERPLEVEGLALMVDASIGVATYPEHGTDADALMQHADVAMYHAKAARTGCEVYTPERDASSRDRLELLGGLRRAVDGDELLLHYQPKADLASGDVVAVEA
ncbi:MAG TPA: diguanylate cyclase, partial [Solirubrobacteraceae bacterium]|nr:diguanylate cyclase [Solirubrobacteraceae bacterium]